MLGRQAQHAKSKASLKLNRKSQGFTLIEVMIAAVLLAIGLLGHMSMAATNLDLNKSGIYHTQATFLLNQMADRMKNNIKGVTSGQYDNKLNLRPDTTADQSGARTGSDQQAEMDIHSWQVEMTNFPGGKVPIDDDPDGIQVTGSIELLDNVDDISVIRHKISMTWTPKREIAKGDNAQKHTVSMIIGTPL